MDDSQLSEARAKRFEDKKETSGRIGDTSRFISFGIVALVFSLHGASDGVSTRILASHETFVNLAGLLACLAIVADYFQYLCGYFSVNDALKNESSGYSYDANNIFYKGRVIFFWLKQALSIFGAIIIVVAFGNITFSS